MEIKTAPSCTPSAACLKKWKFAESRIVNRPVPVEWSKPGAEKGRSPNLAGLLARSKNQYIFQANMVLLNEF